MSNAVIATTSPEGSPKGADLSITLETITPERAAEYLSKNFKGNRTPSKKLIAGYSKQMKAGEWGLSNGVSFDINGVLVNGQHQLGAVIDAGIPVQFYVTRGLDPKSKEYLDLGMSRNASNIAEIRGLSLASTITISIARRMTTPRFGLTVNSGLSKHEVVDVFTAFHDGIAFAYNSSNASGDRMRSGAVLAVIARAYYHENHRDLERFSQILAGNLSYIQGQEDTAPCKLRDFYLKMRAENKSAQLGSSLFNRTQAALSAFLARKPLVVCREKSGNLWPIPELDDAKKFAELREKLKIDPSYRYV